MIEPDVLNVELRYAIRLSNNSSVEYPVLGNGRGRVIHDERDKGRGVNVTT